MATREKQKVYTGLTREQAEEAFAGYNQCVAGLEQLQGKLNAELTAVKEKFESRIGQLQAEKEDQFKKLQAWAEDNPELFQEKKSLDFTHGTIGFRTGMPKLATRKGFKWGAILELVKGSMPDYVRKKEELDKEALLADRQTLGDKLTKVGLEVVQDETFYVQPSLEVVSES